MVTQPFPQPPVAGLYHGPTEGAATRSHQNVMLSVQDYNFWTNCPLALGPVKITPINFCHHKLVTPRNLIIHYSDSLLL